METPAMVFRGTFITIAMHSSLAVGGLRLPRDSSGIYPVPGISLAHMETVRESRGVVCNYMNCFLGAPAAYAQDERYVGEATEGESRRSGRRAFRGQVLASLGLTAAPSPLQSLARGCED